MMDIRLVLNSIEVSIWGLSAVSTMPLKHSHTPRRQPRPVAHNNVQSLRRSNWQLELKTRLINLGAQPQVRSTHPVCSTPVTAGVLVDPGIHPRSVYSFPRLGFSWPDPAPELFFRFFPKQFTVRGSQFFKEWSPWCWMVWSGSQPACLPLPLSPSSFQSGFPAGLSPTSFHLPPNSFHLSPPLLPFICLPLLFIVSQAGCLWSGSGPACLPLPFICLPLLFICLPGWVLVVGFPASLSPTSFHLSPTSFLLVVGFPAGLSPTSSYLFPTSFHLSPTSFHLSPRLGACGRVPGPLVSHLLSFVSRFFSFISQKCFICLPGPSLLVPCSISIHLSLSLLISALFRWPRSISIHLSPRLVTGGVRPFPLFLFICLPGLSLLVSALFRWPCSISVHLSPRSVTASVLSPRSVTAGVCPFRRPCSISIH